MTYFDTHAHYDDPRFDADREALLLSLAARGVGCVINAGSCVESSKASVLMTEAFSRAGSHGDAPETALGVTSEKASGIPPAFLCTAVGVHPHEVSDLTEEGFAEIEALCGHPKVVAIGETGLDFYYDHSPRDTQRYWFKRQLELAVKLNLPVVIHAREASAETFAIIRESGARRGVIHCYSGGVPMALDYIEMGFYIGIGGVVTYDKTKKLPEVVANIPLERILLETDAPYLTPAPHRGKRNDSSYLSYIAEAIARIKNIPVETVAAQTFQNAAALFLKN